MQKIIFPMKYLNITQGYNTGTHKDSYAIDNAGKDSGIEKAYAPFDCKVVKTYDGQNDVWFESLSPVLFADGSIDYAVCKMAHNNDISNIYIGKTFKQLEECYQEGTKGQATGNHIHIEIAKGKFDGSGWHQNKSGYWSLNNAVPPEDAFFLPPDEIIINNGGYQFKWLTNYIGTTVKRDASKNQLEVVVDNLICRNGPSLKDTRLGYINRGIYNYSSMKENDGYTWYEVEDHVWIPNQGTWIIIYPKEGDTNQETIVKLNQTIEELKKQLSVIQKENETIKDKIPPLIFTCPRDGIYAIELKENDLLYLKQSK